VEGPRAESRAVRSKAASASAGSSPSTQRSPRASTGHGCRTPASARDCRRSSRPASATGASPTSAVRGWGRTTRAPASR